MVGSRESPVGLRVDSVDRPLDVDGEPAFSWRLDTDRRNERQDAYQILVARTDEGLGCEEGNVWDSGKIESGRSTGIPYDGPPLAPDTTYRWRVRLWDVADEPTPYSAPAEFRTAPRSLGGEWIAHQPGPGDSNGYRSRWRPLDDETDEWVQIDLGESRRIDVVDLHPAEPFDGPKTPDGTTVSETLVGSRKRRTPRGTAGFGFPNGFRIEVANESSFDDPVFDGEQKNVTNPGTDTVTVDVGGTGRYVRVTTTDPYEVDPSVREHEHEYAREQRSGWRTFALAAVSVRDETGDDLATGRPASASTSIEDATWGVDHLTNGLSESRPASSSPQLRTTLSLSKPVARATARVAVGGYGELYINGEKVGADVLNPAWTQFDKRLLYTTDDVSDRLSAGENAVGLWLGRGWFEKNVHDWTGFGSPRAKVTLFVEYQDGTTRTLTSGPNWTARSSPIVKNDVYDGEVYDARREADGWATPEFDDAEWQPASVVADPGGELKPQRIEPIEVVDTRKPASVQEGPNGTIVDFGQNLTGWVTLDVRDPDAGDRVTIRHAEALTDDGDLSTVDLRSADATDAYVARGDRSCETYSPRFTYHGFRYAKISGYPDELTATDVSANVVHTAMERTGTFDCSDDDLTRIQHCAEWGLAGNSHSVPTDCPQRDERFGWTGDGHLTAQALEYNFDARRFHAKWMADHADAQSRHGYVPATIPFGYGTVPSDPAWSTTQVLIPWYLYRHYGDRRTLRNYFPHMRRYVDYWHSVAEDGIIPAEYGNYGDWLTFENTDPKGSPAGHPLDLFATAAHYQTTTQVGEAAAELGCDSNAEDVRARAREIEAGFNDRFLNEVAGRYEPNTQAAQAIPLWLGMVPARHEESVLETLVASVRSAGDELRTGFLGTRALLSVLGEYGYADLCYRVITSPDRPGWGYMVRNGATTMWERWDSDEKVGTGMNSLNHSPFTLVSEWFYEVLAGICLRLPDRHIEISPAFVDALDWVEGEIQTPYGPARVEWEQTDEELTLDVTVPWNTTATVRVPTEATERISERGRSIWPEESVPSASSDVDQPRAEDDEIVIDIAAGRYEFVLE